MVALDLSYFAWVREAMGRHGETVDVPPAIATIGQLIAWLAARDASGSAAFADPARIRAALNGVMVSLDALLVEGADISLFPPVTGG